MSQPKASHLLVGVQSRIENEHVLMGHTELRSRAKSLRCAHWQRVQWREEDSRVIQPCAARFEGCDRVRKQAMHKAVCATHIAHDEARKALRCKLAHCQLDNLPVPAVIKHAYRCTGRGVYAML